MEIIITLLLLIVAIMLVWKPIRIEVKHVYDVPPEKLLPQEETNEKHEETPFDMMNATLTALNSVIYGEEVFEDEQRRTKE